MILANVVPLPTYGGHEKAVLPNKQFFGSFFLFAIW